LSKIFSRREGICAFARRFEQERYAQASRKSSPKGGRQRGGPWFSWGPCFKKRDGARRDRRRAEAGLNTIFMVRTAID